MAEPVCDHCGYDLGALRRAAGTCPECGQPYDLMRGQGVSTGGAAERHRRGDRVMTGLRTAFLALLALGLLGCGGMLSWLAKNPWPPLLTFGLFAAVAALAAVVSALSGRGE